MPSTTRLAYASAYVRYEGFRSGNGAAGNWPGSYGLSSGAPQLLTPPGPGQAGKAGARIACLTCPPYNRTGSNLGAPGSAALMALWGRPSRPREHLMAYP